MAIKVQIPDDEFDKIQQHDEIITALNEIKSAIQSNKAVVVDNSQQMELLISIDSKITSLINAIRPKPTSWEFRVTRDGNDYIEKVTAEQKLVN